jgi:hypothetical protein
LTAASMSASSKTMNGALPPNFNDSSLGFSVNCHPATQDHRADPDSDPKCGVK